MLKRLSKIKLLEKQFLVIDALETAFNLCKGIPSDMSLKSVYWPVNDIPEVKAPKAQTIKEGQKFAAIKLDDLVTDADHKDNEISWEANSKIKGKKKKVFLFSYVAV